MVGKHLTIVFALFLDVEGNDGLSPEGNLDQIVKLGEGGCTSRSVRLTTEPLCLLTDLMRNEGIL